MTGGLLKLIEILQEVWGSIKPYCVVKAWEKGVILRKGRFHKILDPGYYYKHPILDSCIVQSVVLQSMRGPVQTIEKLHFRWTLKYRITDVKKYVCEISDEENFLRDIVTSNVAARYLDDADNWYKMMRRLRVEAAEGGFEIEKLRLVDLVEARSYRLFGDEGQV